ncbi:hypothetical protein DFH08DRAFT_978621 [Mycena albidolilacea]|uniref:Uncharacterized protein n=1 Tax=Mycena albidolilacea TaxID=1033008 RepID=A0AAD6YY78_9AGAR|nr:hypothetical protein DFH08DRAFT_978621 [Mycena albidolilacea]
MNSFNAACTDSIPTKTPPPCLSPRIKGAVHQRHPLSATPTSSSTRLPSPPTVLRSCPYASARARAAMPVPPRRCLDSVRTSRPVAALPASWLASSCPLNPALQPVRGAAPAPGNLLERAARPLHRRVQVNTHELLRAALPPADPPTLATVPRGGRELVHYGLGSVRSSVFLGVFVIIYQAITLTWHPYRPSFITPTPRTTLWFGRSKVSFESGGWVEAVDRVLAKQPAHRPRGTVCPASPQVACSSLSKAAITLLISIIYFFYSFLMVVLSRIWSVGAFVGVGGTRGGGGVGGGKGMSSAQDVAHRLPCAVCLASPSMSRCHGSHRRTSLFRLHDPRRGGLILGASYDSPTPLELFRALLCVSAGGLGRWAPIPVSAPMSTRYALPNPNSSFGDAALGSATLSG